MKQLSEITTNANLVPLFNGEKNLYDDSWFWVMCWDSKNQCPDKIGNGSTTHPSDNRSVECVDLTDPAWEAYHKWQEEQKAVISKIYRVLNSNDIKVGDECTIVSGRKYPVGTTGVRVLAFYQNQFDRHKTNAKIQLPSGEVVYIDRDHLELPEAHNRFVRSLVDSLYIKYRQGQSWGECIFSDYCGNFDYFYQWWDQILAVTSKKEAEALKKLIKN